MKRFFVMIFLISALFINWGCNKKMLSDEIANSKTKFLFQDTSRWTLLPGRDNSKSDKFSFQPQPSNNEIERTINLWLNTIEKNNINKIVQSDDYKIQLMPLENFYTEKEILVNCFCGHNFPSWRNKLCWTRNGGDCFFFVIVNLNRGKASRILKPDPS